MLFAYTYVPHAMEKMQAFIDFIFFEVWCKAPIGLAFSPDLFDEEPELRGIISLFGFASDAPDRGKQFYKDIKSIYDLFAALSPAQIEQLKQWYEANNDIEKVCANAPGVSIARYADIQGLHLELSAQLAAFFKGLYSQQLLGLCTLRQQIGNIDDHYKAFMSANSTGKCPFCGIADMQGVYHSTREAYDHYLPKGLYPFNSINFHNLVPACHHCNSSYKTSKDPAVTPKDPAGTTHRRKVFYPYANSGHTIEVKIELTSLDIDNLVPDDIQLVFGPSSLNEEIETWKDIYGIEERYKAKCCSESDGKYWLAQVIDEWQENGRSPADFLITLSRQTAISPFADNNFLKKAFLEGCTRVELFNVAPDGPA